MRLLVLSSFLSRRYAGAAHATVTVLRALARRPELEVTAFAFEVDEGVMPDNVPWLVSRAPKPRHFLWRFPSSVAVPDLIGCLREATLPEVDACYTQHTTLGLAYRKLFPHTPIISHTGGMLPDREYAEESGRPAYEAYFEAALINRLERRAYRDPIWKHIVSTPLVAKIRGKHYGIDPDFFHVLPLPVDPERFCMDRVEREGREAWGIPEDVPLVACVARLVPLKQIELLVEAVAAATAQPWLVIAGEGSEAAFLRERARDLGVEGRVRFVGRVDPAPIFAASDFFALPSRLESFGLAYAEAMTMGLPAVGLSNEWAGAVTAAPDVILHGVTGYCVSTKGELMEAIDLLAREPLRRGRMGEQARTHATESFSATAYVERLVQLLG
jgi:glycosyltransferase involved in cell wall biosynthesis